MKTFAEKVLGFYGALKPDIITGNGIEVMVPFGDFNVRSAMTSFYKKFFSDNQKRTFIFGINPGRFGAGTTGITFTDPIRLERECGIWNNLPKKQELSSVFIYELISRFGGPANFYSAFYLTAVCPVGFVRNGKNMNFYDDKILMNSVEDFIINSVQKQIEFGANAESCVCLGEGKNYDFFSKLNEKHRFFGKVIPLAHPRFIMQYRLRKKDAYLEEYLHALKS